MADRLTYNEKWAVFEGAMNVPWTMGGVISALTAAEEAKPESAEVVALRGRVAGLETTLSRAEMILTNVAGRSQLALDSPDYLLPEKICHMIREYSDDRRAELANRDATAPEPSREERARLLWDRDAYALGGLAIIDEIDRTVARAKAEIREEIMREVRRG